MNLFNAILGASLLFSLITTAVLIRCVIAWRVDIRNMYARLNKIEEEVCHHSEAYPVKQEQEMMHHQPSLPEKKPNSIELVQHYIRIYYPTFIDDIVHHTGGKLSSTDELLCMMIKLECTNKEIGTILSITNGSVLTARYRLKRRLKLHQDQQLDTWIQNVGKEAVQRLENITPEQ